MSWLKVFLEWAEKNEKLHEMIHGINFFLCESYILLDTLKYMIKQMFLKLWIEIITIEIWTNT